MTQYRTDARAVAERSRPEIEERHGVPALRAADEAAWGALGPEPSDADYANYEAFRATLDAADAAADAEVKALRLSMTAPLEGPEVGRVWTFAELASRLAPEADGLAEPSAPPDHIAK